MIISNKDIIKQKLMRDHVSVGGTWWQTEVLDRLTVWPRDGARGEVTSVLCRLTRRRYSRNCSSVSSRLTETDPIIDLFQSFFKLNFRLFVSCFSYFQLSNKISVKLELVHVSLTCCGSVFTEAGPSGSKPPPRWHLTNTVWMFSSDFSLTVENSTPRRKDASWSRPLHSGRLHGWNYK